MRKKKAYINGDDLFVEHDFKYFDNVYGSDNVFSASSQTFSFLYRYPTSEIFKK